MDKGLVHTEHVPKEYSDLVQPHVDSMNYFYNYGIHNVVADLKRVEVRTKVYKHATNALRNRKPCAVLLSSDGRHRDHTARTYAATPQADCVHGRVRNSREGQPVQRSCTA